MPTAGIIRCREHPEAAALPRAQAEVRGEDQPARFLPTCRTTGEETLRSPVIPSTTTGSPGRYASYAWGRHRGRTPPTFDFAYGGERRVIVLAGGVTTLKDQEAPAMVVAAVVARWEDFVYLYDDEALGGRWSASIARRCRSLIRRTAARPRAPAAAAHRRRRAQQPTAAAPSSPTTTAPRRPTAAPLTSMSSPVTTLPRLPTAA